MWPSVERSSNTLQKKKPGWPSFERLDGSSLLDRGSSRPCRWGRCGRHAILRPGHVPSRSPGSRITVASWDRFRGDCFDPSAGSGTRREWWQRPSGFSSGPVRLQSARRSPGTPCHRTAHPSVGTDAIATRLPTSDARSCCPGSRERWDWTRREGELPFVPVQNSRIPINPPPRRPPSRSTTWCEPISGS